MPVSLGEAGEHRIVFGIVPDGMDKQEQVVQRPAPRLIGGSAPVRDVFRVMVARATNEACSLLRFGQGVFGVFSLFRHMVTYRCPLQ